MQIDQQDNEGSTISLVKEPKNDSSDRIYELGYLLVPTIAEDNVPTVHSDLKNLISTTFGGEIISDDIPKTMTLAYPMKKITNNIRSKFDTAYFGWVKFALDAEQVITLKKHLDLDINVIRFLIIKTVRENTIATKRFFHRGVGSRPLVVKSPDENQAPINKEEVDKEIDALLTP